LPTHEVAEAQSVPAFLSVKMLECRMADIKHYMLLDMVSYDKETGLFTYLETGDAAKTVGSDGYIRVKIFGRIFKGHRLAWFYVHKVWADGMVDHIDGNRTNNAISNLRVVDAEKNAQNKHHAQKGSTTGLLGVMKARDKFRAKIEVGGKRINLGTFNTAEEAHQKYLEAKKQYHEGAHLVADK